MDLNLFVFIVEHMVKNRFLILLIAAKKSLCFLKYLTLNEFN